MCTIVCVCVCACVPPMEVAPLASLHHFPILFQQSVSNLLWLIAPISVRLHHPHSRTPALVLHSTPHPFLSTWRFCLISCVVSFPSLLHPLVFYGHSRLARFRPPLPLFMTWTVPSLELSWSHLLWSPLFPSQSTLFLISPLSPSICFRSYELSPEMLAMGPANFYRYGYDNGVSPKAGYQLHIKRKGKKMKGVNRRLSSSLGVLKNHPAADTPAKHHDKWIILLLFDNDIII